MDHPATCPQETGTPVPERPDLIEVRCPHYLYPLRYEQQEAPRAAE